MATRVKPSTIMSVLIFGAMAAADQNVFGGREDIVNVTPAGLLQWARFSGDDCVKQVRADAAQCIPCKKNLTDGTVVNRFVGPCKRDATVLASQIFTPWHFCHEGGGCPQGRLPKFSGRVCWAFNKGEFTRYNGPAGVCIKESFHSRHVPTVSYALANMAHGWKNRQDFIAAYQWSMEQRAAWGRPETVMTCGLFCNGQKACGEVGDCTCGEECGSNATSMPPTSTTTTTITTSAHDDSKCLENGQHDDDCCSLQEEAECSDGYRLEFGGVCATWRSWTYYTVLCYPPTSSPAPVPEPEQWSSAVDGAGKACRGASTMDNSASYYLLSQQSSPEDCKAQCLQESRCKGVEYSSTGRCEVWIRPGGIQATKDAPGYTCLRYEPAATPSAFNLVDGGEDRACRGATSTDDSPTYYTVFHQINTLQDCQTLCELEPQCKGVEYSQEGRCEVWTRPGGVQATKTVAGYSCYSYEPIAALGQAEKLVRQHKFLGTALLQTGVASSRLEQAYHLDEL
mmetsp:Transcript_26993/g.81320  ORF Transcript_26993/g.81320 Transcript_26993/m.81320 type:complete len:511 (-) Transcript_26993:248-1780(-)